MELADATTLLTAAIIVITMLTSGPLVPTVDYTTSPVGEAIADKSAASLAVSDIRIAGPEPRIVPGHYEWQASLDLPTVSVRIDAVSGSPLLIYVVTVNRLGKVVTSLAAISDRHVGQRVTLDIPDAPLQKSQITNDSYRGLIELRIRTGNESRTVFQRNVTISAEGLDARN